MKDSMGTSYTSDAETIIKNMPRVRDQKKFEICFGMATAVLVQKHICDSNEMKDCEVPKELEVSPLSTMAWFQKNTAICTIKNGKYFIDAYSSEVSAEECGEASLPDADSMSYTNVRFAGNAYLTLKNAATTFAFHSEACFASDRFFKQFGKSKESADNFVNELKQFYYFNRNKEIDCPSCLVADARGRLNTLKLDEATVRAALQMKNFQEFMFKLMFRDCERIKFSESPVFRQFPDIPLEYVMSPRDQISMSLGLGRKDDIYYLEKGHKIKIAPLSADQLLAKVKDILNQGYPLMLDNLCVERTKIGACLLKHSVVIKGNKKVCNAKECKDFLLLQNSWGENWQSEYDDGWVEADSLLANVDINTIRPGILSWYERSAKK